MNVLPMERQAQILSALVEGNNVRSTSRMSGAHVGTILNLLVRVGSGCTTLMDQMMHALRCQRLEVDEIWDYVGMKQKQASAHPERHGQIGDFYTFVALDAETKLVPCFRVGKRTWNETNAFSKKLENLKAAVALYFAHYNFVRIHKTLRVTPAMAANVSDRLWSMTELVEAALALSN